MTDREARRRFVRETLGCGCPEDVVERTVPLTGPGVELHGVRGGLDVGGRLLVLLVDTDEQDSPAAALETLLASAIRFRDANDFNRVRIVLSTAEPETLERSLRPVAERLEPTGDADGRAHVHVIHRHLWPT